MFIVKKMPYIINYIDGRTKKRKEGEITPIEVRQKQSASRARYILRMREFNAHKRERIKGLTGLH